MQESSIPDFLAGLCDTMSVNGSVCQGFTLAEQHGQFYGGTPDMHFIQNQSCWTPNVTTWIVNAGKSRSPDSALLYQFSMTMAWNLSCAWRLTEAVAAIDTVLLLSTAVNTFAF